MKIKFSIEKDNKTLAQMITDITNAEQFHAAIRNVWDTARRTNPAKNVEEFLAGLDTLFGATLKMEKAGLLDEENVLSSPDVLKK